MQPETAAAILKAMANEARMNILLNLLKGESSVGEINAAVPLSQSALSQHLAVLRREEIVSTRRASQTIYYSLRGNEVSKVIDALGVTNQ